MKRWKRLQSGFGVRLLGAGILTLSLLFAATATPVRSETAPPAPTECPRGQGNAYYILAAQTIAAELNLHVTGVAPTETLEQARSLLATNTPTSPELHPASDAALRHEFTRLAGELASQMQHGADAEGCPPIDETPEVLFDSDGEVHGDIDGDTVIEGEVANTLNAAVEGTGAGTGADSAEPATLAPLIPSLFMPTVSTD